MYAAVEMEFGLNLLRNAPVNDSLVVSPISVIFALAMVHAGAKGSTKSQISSVISKEASDYGIKDYYSKLLRQIMNASHGVKSRIANGFFLNKQFQIVKNYGQTVRKKYGAKVEALDFGQAEEAAKIIDDFISKTTDGKIRGMVNAATVEGAFSLIVSAVYFTADWASKFYKFYNVNGTFYSAEGRERQVEYMKDNMVHRLYAEDDDLQVISLPYKDTSFAFHIFLPKTRFGLGKLRPKLTGERILQLLSKLKTHYITITIPKMRIETDFELKEALMAMGVKDMFSDKADLTGIVETPSLKVSGASHKAIIEVDEEGTTAAAAAMAKLTAKAFMGFPLHFRADHPFLFILTKDKNPLFMGQFV